MPDAQPQPLFWGVIDMTNNVLHVIAILLLSLAICVDREKRSSCMGPAVDLNYRRAAM